MDILEFLPDPTFVIDRDGRVIAWNRAIEEMSTVPKKSMIGTDGHSYAIPFYGVPRPMLIDLVMTKDFRNSGLYQHIEIREEIFNGEEFVPGTYGGKGAYLWGTASPLFDGKGVMIGAIESLRDITEQKETETAWLKSKADLEEKARLLEEANIALSVLLRRREEDKRELEENLVKNIRESVQPFVERLKATNLDEIQKSYIEIIEAKLTEVASPFLRRLAAQFANLTPMEIRVATLIREGKSSKEIAEILGLSDQTIQTHRNSIRAKLRLRNEKTNLRSHLLSLG